MRQKGEEERKGPAINGASLHLRRFYARILRGRSYGGGSVVERIARAATRAEVEALYEQARAWDLSPRTARRIAAAAKAKVASLAA